VSNVEIKAGSGISLGGISTSTSSISIEQPAVNVSIAKGSFDAHFKFAQEQNSDEWVIEHNLGKHPSVTVVDSGDNIVYAEVEYVDLNNLIIRFNGANSGKAYLN
jgi:hypothetical protein